MQEIEPNVIFVYFESFHVKALFFKAKDTLRKDSYEFEDKQIIAIPQLFKKDLFIREAIVNDILEELVNIFELKMQKVFFHIITSDDDFSKLSFKFNSRVHLTGHEDQALIPYFCASFFESYNTAYSYAKYFSSGILNNQGHESLLKWDSWNDIAKDLYKNFGERHKIEMDLWLNTLIRPVIGYDSFYLSSIASYLLKNLQINFKPNGHNTIIAGGEVFSWIKSGEDVFLPFLMQEEILPSFVSIYHDTFNVLSMSKALKGTSLKLLEKSTGMFVRHIGDIVTIKSKRPVKFSDIVGRINIHDDEGVRSIYPVAEDILKVRLKGKARISYDLHYPFFLDKDKRESIARDLLLIDTRSNSNKNFLNMRSWYDRIKAV